MRFFDLINHQHVLLFLVPTLVFILVFGVSLAYIHFHSKDSEDRKHRIWYRYPEGIEDKDAPFPLSMIIIIVGTVIWGFFYILAIGLMDVKI